MTPRAQKSLRIIGLALAASLICALALAQTPTPRNVAGPPCTALTTQSNPSPTHKPMPCRKELHPQTSLSLGASSLLTIDRTGQLYAYTLQGTAPSAGVLGTLRQTFSPWLGYSVNLGYSRVSEQYRNGLSNVGNPNNLNINSNVYETSITYVAHTHVNQRFSLFADIGPGLLTFLPISDSNNLTPYFPDQAGSRGLSVQVRPTGVFGSGIDLHLSHHFDLRAEYRGLFYNNPDFRTGDTLSKRVTLTSEPTLSVVYNFTHPR